MSDLIERDSDALVALALTRQGWTEREIRAAIADATALGVDWPKIMRGLVQLMCIPDGTPADLVKADWRRNARPDVHAHAAAARAALNHQETD